MFAKAQFQFLYKYHWHTNRRILEAASRLSASDYFEKPDDGRRSIHELLFHILRTDHGWREGMETGEQRPSYLPEEFPDLITLQIGFEQEERAMTALLEQLYSSDIEEHVNLTDRRGETFPLLRWRILQHLVLHGMQHHTEAAELLTAKGQSPGDIDFIFFE